MYHLVSALLAYYIPLLKEQLSMFYLLFGKLYLQTMKTEPDHVFMDSINGTSY
jgi:hypothetical protein